MVLSRNFIAAAALIFAWEGRALPGVVDDIVNQVSQSSYSDYLNGDFYAYNGNNRLFSSQHDLAQQDIFDDFGAMGLTPTLEPFSRSGYSGVNVAAIWPGETRPNDVYVIGAHYDSVAGPGANDNASGAAGVLEAARVLTQYRFEATLIFIAFDREEQGLIGSTAYVAAHPGLNVDGMISLDMIAHNTAPGSSGHDQATIYGASAPIRAALANAVANYSGGLTAVDGGTYLDCCSDQRSFENAGFPGALLIESNALSDPYYHTTSDSLDTAGYIDYRYATSMTRAAVGYLAENADPVPEPGTVSSTALVLLIVFARLRRPRRCPSLTFSHRIGVH